MFKNQSFRVTRLGAAVDSSDDWLRLACPFTLQLLVLGFFRLTLVPPRFSTTVIITTYIYPTAMLFRKGIPESSKPRQSSSKAWLGAASTLLVNSRLYFSFGPKPL